MNTYIHRSILSAVLLTAATNAHAANLLNVPLVSVTGPGTASATAFTTVPNNYPATLSPNTLTAPSTINGFSAPLDLLLQGTISGATTQYAATAAVTNNTGLAAGTFTFELGTGTGAAFVQFPNAFVVSFNPTTPVPTSTALPAYSLSPEILVFSGGTFASGSTATFTFNLAYVDNTTGIQPNFTLRETIRGVPEPTSFVMVGLAVLAGLGYARRRRQAAR